MTNELHLKIVTPDRTLMDRKVKAVSFMGVDGSYGILPKHAPLMTATTPGIVEITEVSENRYRVAVEDNGPGIVKQQIPKIFGKLLYGSKFHRLRQSRGQQGIGISAAGMYGQLTTGKGVRIISRTGSRRPAHEFLVQVDTRKNEPKILRDEEVEWDSKQGTTVEIELEGTYPLPEAQLDRFMFKIDVSGVDCRGSLSGPYRRGIALLQ